MKKLGMAIFMAAGMLSLIAPAFPNTTTNQGQGKAIVTVLPKKDAKASVSVLQQDLRLKVNGKESSLTDWAALCGPKSDLELVVLIDVSARTTLGLQLRDIAGFIQSLPARVTTDRNSTGPPV